MSDRPQFPVEPLGEKRWNEIRRNVLAEASLAVATVMPAPAPPSRAPFYAGALSLALAAAALFVVGQPATIEPPASTLSRVVTDDSSATTTAGDATVALGAHTSVLIIERSPDTWVVSLEHGSAHFEVPARHERPAFTVEAGRTRVRVIGTAFTVVREPGATSASVTVDHGAVGVTDGSVDVVLHDGDAWPEREPPAATTTTAEIDPLAAPSTADATSTSRADGTATARVITPATGETTAQTTAPADMTAAADATATSPATDRERYRDAVQREATDPAGALALYEALASGTGVWSAPALMSQARLESELGHPERAHALAETYLARYPTGLNAEDARELLRR